MRKLIILWLGATLLLVGCTTSRIDWNARVGHYNFDTAVRELGVPHNHITLSDGSTAAEWILSRGGTTGMIQHTPGFIFEEYETYRSSDVFLELVFDKAGILTSWKKLRR